MLHLLLACAKPTLRGSAVAAATGCNGCSEPLELVAEVPLPGGPVRFDYQDVDAANGHLVIAHMNDASVVVVNLSDGATVAELTDIQTARGVAVAPEAGLIFVTASPDQVVRIDSSTLTVRDRVTTGRSPDGIAWDGIDGIVGVSDQGDGALSLLPDDGAGQRTQVPLGEATGNVVYDASRGRFWITVEQPGDADQLVAVVPTTGALDTTFGLTGCEAAHGLRLHPDASSAFVACEGNDLLVRVDLGSGEVTTGPTTSGPDVLAIDPGLGWLYVAAEGGALRIYDVTANGVSVIGTQQIGDNAHSVAVDPSTHHVFFPLEKGPAGTPVLRILQPRSM